MNRCITVFIALVLAAVAPASTAFADDPAPTKEQLDAAKKAFGEGKALYEEGKLPEAIDKFKESYRLSKNPLLLYNIGHTLDQAGSKDKALFYYRKFLADAPKTATQRKDVAKRVEEIEKENLEADLNGTTTTTTTTTSGTGVKQPEQPKEPVKVKPAGTYKAEDFQHQIVDAAPPLKPLDLTAFVPEDSGFTVTLYYRGSGDAKFIARTMKRRYNELVGRIPGPKMGGTSVQYYIEVKDQAGNVVTRSGKSTSPNLIYLEAGATPRFYPDLTDDGDTAESTTTTTTRRGDEEDPLDRKQEVDNDPITSTPDPTTPTTPGNGLTDVGSSKFGKAKWISTGIAGGLVAGAIVTYILGSQQASNILADRDSRAGDVCQSPPCFAFDQYDIDVEKAGKRYNTLHTITAVTGVVAVGVAGYFWYKELTSKKKRGDSRAASNSSSTQWAISPAIGDGFTGAAAAARF